ncbi:MAG: Nif3-like dinuclear metal center hexameric protein [Synergistes sp.]|nr:Nif3-like dinuclear metal center hexameric protein [Synergistes sp.]
MKLSDIIEKIEARIPEYWAEDWDNPGLAVGRSASDITRIAVALDATADNVEKAAALGCGMLVTHHPVIFRPVSSVTDAGLSGRALLAAAEKKLAVYSVHTNWDCSPEGVNHSLASLLGIRSPRPLVPAQNGAWGLGASGVLPAPLSCAVFLKTLHERWNLNDFTFYGDAGREIRHIALGGGACQDLWRNALEEGADCFITADVSYHVREEALAAGLNIVSADHGEMERASLPALAEVLKEETGLEVLLLKETKCPYLHWNQNLI